MPAEIRHEEAPAVVPRPTMQDVADRAGVSRSLVSLVFQQAANVSDARRAAVLEAAEALGYRPNRVARNLAQGRTMTIGAVIDDLQNPFFARTIEGIEHATNAAGYQLMLANGGRDPARERAAAATFVDLQVDALFLVGTRGPAEPLIALAQRVPTVFIAGAIDSDQLDSVQVDEDLGCRLAIEHLTGLGHRQIVHVDGGDGASAESRRQGYLRAMAAFGPKAEAEVLPGEFTHEGGVKAAKALVRLGRLPDAIFAANDLIAAGLWMQLERSGLAVPDEVSIVGFDDSSLPGFGPTGLTTVRQPADQLGERAAALVLERIEGRTRARHERIPPELVVRTSTAVRTTS